MKIDGEDVINQRLQEVYFESEMTFARAKQFLRLSVHSSIALQLGYMFTPTRDFEWRGLIDLGFLIMYIALCWAVYWSSETVGVLLFVVPSVSMFEVVYFWGVHGHPSTGWALAVTSWVASTAVLFSIGLAEYFGAVRVRRSLFCVLPASANTP